MKGAIQTGVESFKFHLYKKADHPLSRFAGEGQGEGQGEGLWESGAINHNRFLPTLSPGLSPASGREEVLAC